MRTRADILHAAIKKTDKGQTIPESDVKLRLLQLEVLVDIRDAFTQYLAAGHTLEIIKRLIQ